MRRGARAFALFCVVVASGCARARPDASPTSGARASASKAAATPTALPIEVIGTRRGKEPVRLTERSHGKVSFTVVADALRGHYAGRDTGTSDLVNPHVTFAQAGGKRLIAVAPAGTVVERDKTVRMTGGVAARSQDGMTLASDTLRYDDQTQIVHGAGHVVVTFPRGERLSGDTVDWNLRTGDVQMNSGTP